MTVIFIVFFFTILELPALLVLGFWFVQQAAVRLLRPATRAAAAAASRTSPTSAGSCSGCWPSSCSRSERRAADSAEAWHGPSSGVALAFTALLASDRVVISGAARRPGGARRAACSFALRRVAKRRRATCILQASGGAATRARVAIARCARAARPRRARSARRATGAAGRAAAPAPLAARRRAALDLRCGRRPRGPSTALQEAAALRRCCSTSTPAGCCGATTRRACCRSPR